MSRRLLDHDPFTGITEYYHDLPDGKCMVETVQDVEERLDRNKALANHGDRGYGTDRDKWLRRVGSIPNVVILAWLKEGIDIFSTDPAMKLKVRRLLNDPDWRWLRTAPGR